MSRIGSARAVAALTLILAGIAFARRRSLALVIWCMAVPAVAGVLEIFLKRLVGRGVRTGIDPQDGVAHLVHPPYTFPSGHVVGIAAVVTVAVAVFGTTRRRSLAASIAGAILVLTIGYTRVAIGAHTFTDVAGGFLLALVIACVATSVQSSVGGGPKGARSTDERSTAVGRLQN